jgi:hypothetical protein
VGGFVKLISLLRRLRWPRWGPRVATVGGRSAAGVVACGLVLLFAGGAVESWPIAIGPLRPNRAAVTAGNVTGKALFPTNNSAVADYGGATTEAALLGVSTNVTTYHNDVQRTGWNQTETTLTPANVTPSTFGLLAITILDDQVDAQPLVVTNQTIEGQGVHTALSPALQSEVSSPALATTPQDPGFFTSVSSNGTQPNTAIIWAIGRPTGTDDHIILYAFNGTASGSVLPLWSGPAGTWPNLGGNVNLVPTVANGRVYVASHRQLEICGFTAPQPGALGKPAGQRETPQRLVSQASSALLRVKPGSAVFWGTIKSIHDSRIVLVLRGGEMLQVDLSGALKQGTAVEPIPGRNVVVEGKFNTDGVFEARMMLRAKGRESWGPDGRIEQPARTVVCENCRYLPGLDSGS